MAEIRKEGGWEKGDYLTNSLSGNFWRKGEDAHIHESISNKGQRFADCGAKGRPFCTTASGKEGARKKLETRKGNGEPRIREHDLLPSTYTEERQVGEKNC